MKDYQTLEATRERIASAEGNVGNRKLILGIWDKGELTGEVSLKPHKYNQGVDVIEYWVSRNHRGRGLARLAAQGATSYSLNERGAERVFAGINARNEASKKVVRPLGFIVLPPPQKDWYGVTRDGFAAAQQEREQ